MDCRFVTVVTLLQILTFLSTDVVYLYKRPTERKKWSEWTISRPAASGSLGWHKSQNGDGNPRYSICDVTGQQPNTWLRSNPITVSSTVKKVDITIKYSIRNCTKLGGDNYCREYFDFYLHQSENPVVPDPLRKNASYEKIAEITTLNLGFTVREAKTFIVDVKGVHMVLAFHNQGSCNVIYSVKVSYYVCPEFTVVGGLVSLPRFIAPANKSVPVQGSCVTNSVYHQGVLSVDCHNNGVWNISSLKGRCICKEDMENSKGECKDCVKDKYNDQNGFKCSVIPSAPRIFQVIFVNKSALELKWQPPAVTGDQTYVFYDVDCRKPCESENNKKCGDKSCGSDVIFIPRKDDLNFTHVTVGNLSPFIKYTVKIYARNRVSEVAKRKHGIERNYAEIIVRINRPSACFSIDLVTKRTRKDYFCLPYFIQDRYTDCLNFKQ